MHTQCAKFCACSVLQHRLGCLEKVTTLAYSAYAKISLEIVPPAAQLELR